MLRDEDVYPPPSLREKASRDFQEEIFPTTPLVSSDLMGKFDIDLLFAIFYYQRNSYERMLAAKELKKREWGFNKKYQIWFKRISQPKEVGQDYEKGDFLIFDFEELWTVKKSTNFVFESKYLETDI